MRRYRKRIKRNPYLDEVDVSDVFDVVAPEVVDYLQSKRDGIENYMEEAVLEAWGTGSGEVISVGAAFTVEEYGSAISGTVDLALLFPKGTNENSVIPHPDDIDEYTFSETLAEVFGELLSPRNFKYVFQGERYSLPSDQLHKYLSVFNVTYKGMAKDIMEFEAEWELELSELIATF